MFKNYFIITWRNFLRQKEYALLNVIGLSIGLASCIVILLYVHHEISYDKFHTKADRIYRVIQKLPESQSWAWTGGATAHIVKNEFKEIESVVSLLKIETHITYEKSGSEPLMFREGNFFFADAEFFKVFDFPLVSGDVSKTLEEPYFVLVTQRTAKRIFGDDDPLGKVIKTTGDNSLTVTGVLKDPPLNSHIQFDFITGMATFKAIEGIPLSSDFGSHWWPSVWTYILLNDKASASFINDQLPDVMKKHRNPDEVNRFVPSLQAMPDIHLHSELSNEITPNGKITTVYIFVAVAVFTLLLACINFINLATARAVKRSKEIGVRKSIGAKRKQLVLQFFTESAMMNILALALAVLLVDLTLPLFNSLMQLQLSFHLFQQKEIWMIITSVIVLSSAASGFYPAVYLSGFNAVDVLKGNRAKQGGRDLRKGLVLFQFALSVLLLFCTSVVYYQVEYLQNVNLGFDKEHVLIIKSGVKARANFEVLCNKLLSSSAVKNVAGSSTRPGVDAGWGPSLEYPGQEPEERLWIFTQSIDHNYFEMMNIPIIAGRGFSKDINDEGTGTKMRGQFPAYENRNFIANEAAVKYMKTTPEQAIGMPIRTYTEENGKLFSETKGRIVGVVKDFNTVNLRNNIEPTIFSPLRSVFGNEARFILVKLNEGEFSESLGSIKKIWKEVNDNLPLEYSFLDEDLQQQYQQETRIGNLVGVFALLTLVISCLGLFGLSAYTAETRVKEIGIRKVLGATERMIITLLSKDYLILVITAVVIASPVAWLIMDKWLEQFAYRVSVNVWLILAVSLLSVAIAFITISFQSFKAASANPVKSLRSE